MRLSPESQQCLGPETVLSTVDTMTGLLSVSTECARSLLNCSKCSLHSLCGQVSQEGLITKRDDSQTDLEIQVLC